jgi:hypothetical protein
MYIDIDACIHVVLLFTLQPPKSAKKKLSKAEKEKLKKEEAEQKLKEEGKQSTLNRNVTSRKRRHKDNKSLE